MRGGATLAPVGRPNTRKPMERRGDGRVAEWVERLLELATDLREWLSTQYPDHRQVEYVGELDAGYPGWEPLERAVGDLFDTGCVQTLTDEALDALLFVTSRNEERGRILAWLGPARGTPLSHVGHLSVDDFLWLCERALERPEDYCDYELATCFRKLESVGSRERSLLERLGARRDEYTRAQARLSLEQSFGPR